MSLKTTISELSNQIDENRQEMYEMIKNNGISHPSVLKISQELDMKISTIQKRLYEN